LVLESIVFEDYVKTEKRVRSERGANEKPAESRARPGRSSFSWRRVNVGTWRLRVGWRSGSEIYRARGGAVVRFRRCGVGIIR